MRTLWYWLSLFATSLLALERCPNNRGGGFCPSKNTCCQLVGSRQGKTSGCLPSDLGAYNATCCNDGLTGCGVGYICGPRNTCIAKPENTDPLVQTLPRYQLCQAPGLEFIYGFGKNHVKPAYYASMGNLETPTSHHGTVREIIFVVHGAGRNADDYFCTMFSATQKQSVYGPDEVLVIAPRFAAESDERFSLHNGGEPMRWNGGSWRYGAESFNNVSSFQVLDTMIEFVSNTTEFPYLEHIQVIGHSAGGQFVQRWALLTNAWAEHPNLRAIVVNPSSFAYLTPLRKSHTSQEWTLPDPSKSKCPEYNDWEWGLSTTDSSPFYVRQVLSLWSTQSLTTRFANRDVVYLAGDRDICNVPGMSKSGWCYSHGLETLCMDMMEGRNRLERHMNYFESLTRLVNVTTHRRNLVPGVGHDHSLIFHSEVVMKYLFDLRHQLDVSVV